MNLFKEIRNKRNINETIENLSSLYIELSYDFLKEPIVINFLLNTNIDPPIHFSLKSKQINISDIRVEEIFKNLFGASKHQDWLYEFINFLHNFDISAINASNILTGLTTIKYKLKITIILFLTVSYNLIQSHFDITKKFLDKLFSRDYKYQEIISMTNHNNITLNMGLSLLYEFFEIFSFYFDNYMESKVEIKQRIYEEIQTSIQNYINIKDNYNDLYNSKNIEMDLKMQKFTKFFDQRTKRLNSTLFMLMDLGFSNDKYDKEILESAIALGRYIEIKITLLRDYTRFLVSL